MRLYQLLWQLLKHALHGRFRDEVFVAIDWNTPGSSGSVAGAITDFRWEDDADAFCTIDAVSPEGPWSLTFGDEPGDES